MYVGYMSYMSYISHMNIFKKSLKIMFFAFKKFGNFLLIHKDGKPKP